MRIPNYVVLTSADSTDLSNKVDQLLAGGWKLHGSLKVLYYASEGRVRFYQAMVLPKEPPDAK